MGAHYTTAAIIKAVGRLSITGTAYDAVLTSLAGTASRWIDQYAGSGIPDAFAAPVTPVARVYDDRDIYDGALDLGAPLLTLTSITNGDGSTIPTADAILLPRNADYHRLIRLKSTSLWSLPLDEVITITGVWGLYAAGSTPAPVAEACAILAGWMFKRYQAALTDATAVPELGEIVYTEAMPKQVISLLLPYRSTMRF